MLPYAALQPKPLPAFCRGHSTAPWQAQDSNSICPRMAACYQGTPAPHAIPPWCQQLGRSLRLSQNC
eukprot:6180972-Pleurochrysis_carterae.AAC.1